MQEQEQQGKTVADYDREIEALQVRLRNREVAGAMLELLSDDELRCLAEFVDDCMVVANSRGFAAAIELARSKAGESKKE